ncbi:sulfatase [Phocaeicola coprocola]|uniref:sulfatase family protein n=1 Tax=Phocaeicola coprocola TaxID=310298 RepID=UPI00241FA695|nr:sulfatase [Phocaeicola coprocola]
MNSLKLSLFLLGTTPLFSFANNVKKDTRPNIIHIMTDDHSFQTISAYGHPISQLAPTPNLDRLASEGMLFTKGYVENSLSAPSRATLLTGMYSHMHGQETLGPGLDTTLTVFPELLQEAGYQTAIIGKWHLHCEPKGFDYYKILYDQGDYYNPEFKTKDTNGKYVREEGYATTLITDYSLEWLDKRDKNKPFCLLLHPKAPHRNWMPEQKYLNLYDDVEFPYPATLFDDYKGRKAASTQEMSIKNDMTWAYDLKVDQLKERDNIKWTIRDWERALGRMTPEERAAWDAAYKDENEELIRKNLKGDDLIKWKYQRYIRDYVRCIKSLDDQIGRVLDYLDKNGLTDNTIIVYTSDQGFYMGEHGWFDKRFMYEESFRTPLIIRYPEKIKNKGIKCDALVQNIDFAPTYLSLAGVEQPSWMVGRSLIDLMENDGKTPADWRKTLYYHYYDYPAIHMVRRHDGVSDGRYKLIHFYGKGKGKDTGNDIDEWELYDTSVDSLELNNIYNEEENNIVIEYLKRELSLYREKYKVNEF